MAEITAKMVSQLREETGAGMMDCKKALTEAGGDIEEARTILRKKGAAKAGQKSETRTASEGITDAFVSESGSVGVLLEVNSETDFVARNEAFHALAHELSRALADAGKPFSSVEEFLASPAADGKTINDVVTEAIARLGEKIAVARFERFDASTARGAVGAYIHRTDFKTGVLVEIASDKEITNIDALTQLARDVAMHVAATRPQYLNPEDVPAELLDKEREIAIAKQDADPSFANKPEAAKKAMIEGQVRKYLEQCVLTEQGFVRDPSGKQKIKALVAEVGKSAGATLKIVRFARYRVGEVGGNG
ncbi:MAG: translation elongation factor Ts [Capsulimonadaceae bacterium]|nr:translation elongation factor Ts [Capsulimonadaceae bacterium]